MMIGMSMRFGGHRFSRALSSARSGVPGDRKGSDRSPDAAPGGGRQRHQSWVNPRCKFKVQRVRLARALDLDLDLAPAALAEAQHGQHAPREVTQHDRQPDVRRHQRPRALDEQCTMPIGTAICEARVMNSGLRVSPVPCKPPV